MKSLQLFSWLSRHATPIMAGSILLGLILQPVATLLAPLLTASVIWMLIFAVARTPMSALQHHLRQPTLVIGLLIWIHVGVSLLAIVFVPLAPEVIREAVILNLCAPPLIATAAVAYMLRGDGALALLTTFLSSAIAPFTIPFTASVFHGIDLALDPLALVLRLSAIVGTSFVAGTAIRKWLGEERAEAHRETLSGLTVLGLVIFGFAVMHGVTPFLIDNPDFAVVTLLTLLVLNAGLQLLTYLLCRFLDYPQRIVAALLAGNRNVGLILAGFGASASIELVSYVGLAQLPIFMLPMLQSWLLRKVP